MNSYPQVTKVIHTLLETPKRTRNNRHHLTSGVRSPRSARTALAVSSRRAYLTGALCIAIAIGSPIKAFAVTDKDHYKLYLHSQIVIDKQYQCAYALYMAESKFDPRAKNGSHYGIPQLRNSKLKHLDGYTQIQWGMRYVAHRYKNDYCLAYKHFKDKGWH